LVTLFDGATIGTSGFSAGIGAIASCGSVVSLFAALAVASCMVGIFAPDPDGNLEVEVSGDEFNRSLNEATNGFPEGAEGCEIEFFFEGFALQHQKIQILPRHHFLRCPRNQNYLFVDFSLPLLPVFSLYFTKFYTCGFPVEFCPEST
jgi:hypothetical protein